MSFTSNIKNEISSIQYSESENFAELSAILNIGAKIFDDKFEIYTYIKNKDKITSPLLLWKTDSEEKANNYYNRLVEIIKSQDYNVLIGFCKSGL